MSYAPTTDLLALLRNTSNGVRVERIPGLDYIMAALSRANMFNLWVGSTPPTTAQAITVWLLPASQSWSAESSVYLWNVATAQYEPATPDLWSALFVASATVGYVFQSVTGANGAVAATTTMIAIQRAAPAATALTLPSVAARNSVPLQVVDWSSGVAAHTITITPAGGETIMRAANLQLFSTAVQLSGVTLYPSLDLSGWVVAP